MDDDLSENQIETQIIQYAQNLSSCLIYKTPTVGRVIGHKRIPAKTCEEKGKSDIVLCFHGFYIAVEVKKPGEKQSEDQKAFEKKVIESGGEYWLIDSLDEFIHRINLFKW